MKFALNSPHVHTIHFISQRFEIQKIAYLTEQKQKFAPKKWLILIGTVAKQIDKIIIRILDKGSHLFSLVKKQQPITCSFDVLIFMSWFFWNEQQNLNEHGK